MEIDLNSASTEVLFNPRLPESETRGLSEKLQAAAHLPSHVWVASSGSSQAQAGAAKWVALSKAAIQAAAAAVNAHLMSDRHDRWIHALPFFHVGGLGVLARANLSQAQWIDGLMSQEVAKEVGRDRRWSAEYFHRRCEQEKATLSALVPTQVYDLVRAGLKSPNSLRAIVVGGAALNETLYQEARALGWRVLPSYGLTECCAQVATASLSSLSATSPDFPELEILGHVEIDSTAEGLLKMRGPSLLTGYALIHSETSHASHFVRPLVDGWYVSEDRGSVTGGSLRIEGRHSDFVKIGGESVDLGRLNRIFDEIKTELKPAVDLVIVAVPDPRLGHAIHGVVGAMGATATNSSINTEYEIRRVFDTFDRRVLPFERIRAVHILREIPRSPLQKLLKSQLISQIVLKQAP